MNPENQELRTESNKQKTQKVYTGLDQCVTLHPVVGLAMEIHYEYDLLQGYN